MKYCLKCKQNVTPTGGANLIITIILLLFFLIPGIIYILWVEGKSGKCPMCGSTNWGNEPELIVKKRFGRTTLIEK